MWRTRCVELGLAGLTVLMIHPGAGSQERAHQRLVGEVSVEARARTGGIGASLQIGSGCCREGPVGVLVYSEWEREALKRQGELQREAWKRQGEWRREQAKRMAEQDREAWKRWEEAQREALKREAEWQRERAKKLEEQDREARKRWEKERRRGFQGRGGGGRRIS